MLVLWASVSHSAGIRSVGMWTEVCLFWCVARAHGRRAAVGHLRVRYVLTCWRWLRRRRAPLGLVQLHPAVQWGAVGGRGQGGHP